MGEIPLEIMIMERYSKKITYFFVYYCSKCDKYFGLEAEDLIQHPDCLSCGNNNNVELMIEYT